MAERLPDESRVADWLAFGRPDWARTELGRLCHPVRSLNVGMQEKQVLSLSYGRVIVRPLAKMRGLLPASFETYQVLRPGDIVIRPTDLQNDQKSLRVGQTNDAGIITSAYISLRPTSDVSHRYLFHLLSAYDFMKVFYGFGSGLRQNLDFKHIRHIPAALPAPDEQQLIVRYIDNVELRIARAVQAKQQMAQLLREQRDVISDTWLVRGGRNTPQSVNPEIPELGDTPEGWDTIACRYLFREITRHDLLATDPKMSLSLAKGLVRSSELSAKSAAESDRLTYKRCAPGDIVMNKYRAYLGAFSVAHERGRITPNYTVLAPRTQLESEYFALLYATPSYQAIWRRASYGVGDGMMPLYTANFYRVKSLLPPADEIARVLAGLRSEAAAIDAALASVEREIALLSEYRMRLISDVVTGKKDVRAEAAGMKDVDPVDLAEVLAGVTPTENDEVGEDDDAE